MSDKLLPHELTPGMEQIRFATRVLGPVAAYRLEKHQVTQTLRSDNDGMIDSILNGRVSAGDQLEVFLDSISVGHAELIFMEITNWGALGIEDAHRGGFDSLDDLESALKRAGYRFKPLSEYEFFRIQFTWLEASYPSHP